MSCLLNASHSAAPFLTIFLSFYGFLFFVNLVPPRFPSHYMLFLASLLLSPFLPLSFFFIHFIVPANLFLFFYCSLIFFSFSPVPSSIASISRYSCLHYFPAFFTRCLICLSFVLSTPPSLHPSFRFVLQLCQHSLSRSFSFSGSPISCLPSNFTWPGVVRRDRQLPADMFHCPVITSN